MTVGVDMPSIVFRSRLTAMGIEAVIGARNRGLRSVLLREAGKRASADGGRRTERHAAA